LLDSTKISETDELVLKLLSVNLKFQGLNKTFEYRFGLSIVQWAFMKTLLQMPAASPQGLAKALNVTPGTLTQTAARLERKKFIFVCSDPKDARKKMLSITREGKDVLDDIDKHYELVFSKLMAMKREIFTIEKYLGKTIDGVIEPEASLREDRV
jgi:DNA-binding MarR family transcriptional regulator